MGRAVTMCKITAAKYEEAKPFVNLVGGSYKANFDKKYAELTALRNKAIEENKTVYYESEADVHDVPKPDAQNFVNLTSVQEQLMGNEMDGKLRHLVPPQVRVMQDELRNCLQAIIQEQFSNIQKSNDQLQGFLKSCNLPMALQSLGAGQSVPDDVWAKIEEFQKNGGTNKFNEAMSASITLVEVNN
jgi:hypothetical protein